MNPLRQIMDNVDLIRTTLTNDQSQQYSSRPFINPLNQIRDDVADITEAVIEGGGAVSMQDVRDTIASTFALPTDPEYDEELNDEFLLAVVHETEPRFLATNALIGSVLSSMGWESQECYTPWDFNAYMTRPNNLLVWFNQAQTKLVSAIPTFWADTQTGVAYISAKSQDSQIDGVFADDGGEWEVSG